MPTTRITIERRLRPLRVGYRANPSSVDEVRRAIEVATAQWGGLLHPIIPVFRRRPTGWHQGPLRAPTAREIEAAYLKSFECDFVVDAQLGAADRKDSLRDITFDQLVTPDNWGHITAGLAADAVYGHVWHQEFRFDSARRVPAALPRSPSGPMELFIEACFGRFSAERPDLEARYRKAFDADDLVVSPESLLRGFAAVRSPGFLTPLTLGVYGLSISPRERSRELSILLLDGTRVSDIVDFWNLRAAGHPVIPVPIQWKGGLVEPLAELILGSEYAQERRHVELRGTHLGDDETLAAFQRELAERV